MNEDTADIQNELAVSVIIAVYNDADHLADLHEELIPVLESLGKPFEVIYVDDGSLDSSPTLLRQFYEADDRVCVIRFARRFGTQMANTAGLRHARGRASIIMDADLELSPKHIPEFIERLDEGYDIAYADRTHVPIPLYRRVGRVCANWLIRKTTGISIPDNASGIIALNHTLVRTLNQFNEQARYLEGLSAWLAAGRYALVQVTRRERPRRSPKQNIFSMVASVLNTIVIFSSKPLQFALWAGLALLLLSALPGIWWAVAIAGGGWSRGEPALLLFAVLFTAGVQLASLGIMGEYIGRIYNEVRKRPLYTIAEVYEHRASERAVAS